jgi:hypothetical protein
VVVNATTGRLTFAAWRRRHAEATPAHPALLSPAPAESGVVPSPGNERAVVSPDGVLKA